MRVPHIQYSDLEEEGSGCTGGAGSELNALYWMEGKGPGERPRRGAPRSVTPLMMQS